MQISVNNHSLENPQKPLIVIQKHIINCFQIKKNAKKHHFLIVTSLCQTPVDKSLLKSSFEVCFKVVVNRFHSIYHTPVASYLTNVVLIAVASAFIS